MNRLAWIIIFSVILASAAAVVGVVVVAYKRPYMPVDWGQSPQGKAPAETVVTDERILRLEVQLKSSDRETRLGAIFELAGLAEDNPQRLGPVLLRALDNEDAWVRFLAANKLGGIKYTAAAGALATLLDDPDRGVSAQAIESLVKLDEVALRAVMEGLGENKIKNIDAALDAARRISGRSFLPGERGRRAALKYWGEQHKQGR